MFRALLVSVLLDLPFIDLVLSRVEMSGLTRQASLADSGSLLRPVKYLLK